MLERIVVAAVSFSQRRAKLLVVFMLLLAVVAGVYVKQVFRMDTDTANMISSTLPWRQHVARLNQLFPQNTGLLVVVIDGDTPDAAEDSAATLYAKMKERPDLFATVRRPDGGPFFEKYGMLYLPADQVQKIADSVIEAQAFIGSLTADPSLRGLFGTLTTFLQGVESNAIPIDRLEKPLSAIAGTLNEALTGGKRGLSWQTMLIDRPVDRNMLRHLILAQPKRDFTALKPGAKATQFVRETAAALGINRDIGVTLRLTGPVALNDEEFGTVAEGLGLALIVSAALVLGLLFAALRSFKLIFATFATLAIGLVFTFAFAFIAIGSLNLISVAFAVMFIGLSIDFGIQFGVRYGQERFECDDDMALVRAGRAMAMPLTLAAVAIAVGFASFMPTSYRGVSELGLIATGGMAVTLVLNLTLLPALLQLVKPRGRPTEMGFKWNIGIDRFLLRYRWPVVGVWSTMALIGAALLPGLTFDFHPLHLKDARTESMSTILDLMKDPLRSPYMGEVITPNIEAAQVAAAKLKALPEVYAALTGASFVPADQAPKLAILQDVNDLMGLSLDPLSTAPPPSPAEIRAAFQTCAARLRAVVPSSDIAMQLARFLDQAAAADPALYPRFQHMLVDGLMPRLATLRASLGAGPLTLDTLPPEIKADWIAADGEARVMVVPKGDNNNSATLEKFVTAVRSVAPDATGPAVQIYESGRAVADAFRIATLTALGAITLLLFLILRRVRDVFFVLATLLVAGLIVIGISVIAGLQLNFANIIALPLLLGIGVAFNIYFAVNWRRGIRNPLSTSTARAVLYSALTTASSFGSLAMSSHPGTAGMGLLLLISLCAIMASIFLFMPALMGPPPSEQA